MAFFASCPLGETINLKFESFCKKMRKKILSSKKELNQIMS